MAALTRLKMKRYKAFDEVDLAFDRPLTVVLGKNNAGKSALLRAPVFATGGLDFSATSTLPLEVRGERFGNAFLDVAKDGNLAGVEVTLEADGCDDLHLHLTAEQRGTPKELVRTLRLGDQVFPSADALRRAIAATAWPSVERGVSWLTSERTLQATPVSDAPRGVGPRGQDTLAVLHAAHFAEAIDAIDQLHAWTRAHLGGELTWRMDDAGLLTPRVQPVGSAIDLPSRQVGAGFNQLLPILVELMVRPALDAGHLLLVEQPVLHLHPALHAEIAQCFVDGVQRVPTRRVVVETHSDAFVLRLRALVAEGQLSPDDVRLLFVADGAHREITLDRNGTPDGWPKGVFFEPFEEYERIRRARRAAP